VAFRDGEPPDGLSTRPKTLVDRVGDFPSGRGDHGAKVFIVTLIPECPSAPMIAREEDGRELGILWADWPVGRSTQGAS